MRTARTMLARRLARHGLVVSGGVLTAVLSQSVASACVPPSVVSSTIKAASLFAAGQPAVTGAISVKVAALTEGVLKTMLLTKLKIASAVLAVGVAVAAAGAGRLLYHTQAAEPAIQQATGQQDEGRRQNEIATETKKDPKAKPDPPQQAAVEEKPFSGEVMRSLLHQHVQFGGLEDPETSLSEALDFLAKRYNLSFDINKDAFEEAEIAPDVEKLKILANKPLPAMHTRLGAVLQKILNRVSPSATYIIRDDVIEITTVQAALREALKEPAKKPALPPIVP